MVGHTGNQQATETACRVVDKKLWKIVEGVLKQGGVCVITADHGNAEDMSGNKATTHTSHKVPLIIIGAEGKLKKGGLQDVAPTVLNVIINSTDELNRTNGTLIGLFVFNDSDFSDVNVAK